MKCTTCNTDNILRANYCRACGAQFTDAQKEKAAGRDPVTLLKKADELTEKGGKLYEILTLKFLTENVWVRLAVLVLPFLLGSLLGGGSGGAALSVADSPDYDVYFNTTTQEYFLQMDKQQVDLMLSVPAGTGHITVVSPDGYTATYGLHDAITLTASAAGGYTVQAVTDDSVQSIVLYTVPEQTQ